MKMKSWLVITLSAGFCLAQVSEKQTFNEQDFRRAVQEGLQPDETDRPMWFAIAHQEIAIPILVAEMKARAKLNDPGTDFFMRKAAGLATHRKDERAFDVAADLCRTDQKRFSWVIDSVLTGARGYGREYELAYYAIEKYPDLQNPIVRWFEASLEPANESRLARQLLKREKAGYLIKVGDPLLSRLSDEDRLRIQKAIERARIEEGHQRQ